MAMERRVLFLCTGNYYRSRFAEILFNARAGAAGLAWRADSRALAIERLDDMPDAGPISPHTLAGLRARGLPEPDATRFPWPAREEDFRGSRLVIALKEAEHRPLLAARFPDWVERVEYWHVHDLDAAEPAEALAEIERAVDELVARLARAGPRRKRHGSRGWAALAAGGRVWYSMARPVRRCSSMAEHGFCKPGVAGSTPAVGCGWSPECRVPAGGALFAWAKR